MTENVIIPAELKGRVEEIALRLIQVAVKYSVPIDELLSRAFKMLAENQDISEKRLGE